MYRLCIDIVLPDLVNKEGAYRAAPELSQDPDSVFSLPSKDGNSSWLVGKMSVAPVNGVLLSDALMSAEVAVSPLLDPLHGWLWMFSTELICHKVTPKSCRMHQERPEPGGLYCAPLCQATGYICVNSR